MSESRGYGNKNILLVECINPKLSKYRVRWDIQPYTNEVNLYEGVSFVEQEFTHKPSIAEIKDTILNWINLQIDGIILTGFTWKDMEVWLSTENQFNYKAAYDLAVQTNGANLPVTFKFGTTEAPTYYEFNSLAELSDFYTKAMSYINTTLQEGWEYKDKYDWSVYELYL